MLRILKLRKQLELANKRKGELEGLKSSFLLRVSEFETAMSEAETTEDIALVEEQAGGLDEEVAANDAEIVKVDVEIKKLEDEIKEIQDNTPSGKPDVEQERKQRTEETTIMRVSRRRESNPFKQSRDERSAYLARSEVKEFYERVLNLAHEKRGVNNAELGIPEVMLGLIRDSIDDYSVLLNRVDRRSIRGDGKAIIAGKIPEAVWTECCAKINELDIDFSDMYVYCHKVAGYIPVCNATLEDFQVAGISSLAAEIEFHLLKAIGYALDKAVIYGDGSHMPTGFVSALEMTKDPNDSSKTWKSLVATNTGKINSSSVHGVDLFKAMARAVGGVKRHTARGGMTYIMNETTWNSILFPETMAFNAAAAIVAAANNAMPGLGGSMIFLDFIPDGDVVGGYLDNFLLVERAGIQMALSEHYFFLDDNTVFKATARYDGTPIPSFRDSFFALNLKNINPMLTATFAPDKANEPEEPDEGE